MRETLLLFIVLTEYSSSSCLFCPVLSSLTHHKLQQKLFLQIYYKKGLQNNILKM